MRTIFRTDGRDRAYTSIANRLLQDSRVSWATRGLLADLISRPANWRISINGVVAMSAGKAGRTRVLSMLEEAVEFGYMRREQSRAKGQYGDAVYMVSDDPEFLASIPVEEFFRDNDVPAKPSIVLVGTPDDDDPATSDEDLPMDLPRFEKPTTVNRTQQTKERNKLKKETKTKTTIIGAADDGEPAQNSEPRACVSAEAQHHSDRMIELEKKEKRVVFQPASPAASEPIEAKASPVAPSQNTTTAKPRSSTHASRPQYYNHVDIVDAADIELSPEELFGALFAKPSVQAPPVEAPEPRNPEPLVLTANEPEKPAKKKSRARSVAPGTYDELFEKFWSAYPKKVGKKQAHKIWLGLPQADKEFLPEAAKLYAEERRKASKTEEEFRKFTCHGDNFLAKDMHVSYVAVFKAEAAAAESLRRSREAWRTDPLCRKPGESDAERMIRIQQTIQERVNEACLPKNRERFIDLLTKLCKNIREAWTDKVKEYFMGMRGYWDIEKYIPLDVKNEARVRAGVPLAVA